MSFAAPPPVAAWLHRDGRTGFEVAELRPLDDGMLVTGCTTAVEDDAAWIVDYELRVRGDWCTRNARVTGRSGAPARSVTVEGDGSGHWRVDGQVRDDLDGCLDVDLESSALTNAFPVHRLDLRPAQSAEAPAVYVRTSLVVQRLEQTYTRLDDGSRYRYLAPAFDFECELVYDASGFALDYPGIAERSL